MTQPAAAGTALTLLANRLQVSEAEIKQSLTQTVFKGATDAQMTALLVVASEYGLNPFTRELYAFPSRSGIVPVVSIDGWLRIINDHPQFGGMDIVYADNIVTVDKSRPCPEYIEVTIRRKDRPLAATPIREYLDECYRNTEPWNTMTRRMLRHKAIKEAARVTIGLHGIFDIDEAADMLAHEGKRVVAVDDTYDVVDESPELITEADYYRLCNEMDRVGLSLDAIARNLAAKVKYTGGLEDMPVPVFDSLMAGLAKMPTKVPPEPENAEVPPGPGAAPDPASCAATAPDPKASAELLKSLFAAGDRAGLYEIQVMALADTRFGVDRPEDLGETQAETLIAELADQTAGAGE